MRSETVHDDTYNESRSRRNTKRIRLTPLVQRLTHPTKQQYVDQSLLLLLARVATIMPVRRVNTDFPIRSDRIAVHVLFVLVLSVYSSDLTGRQYDVHVRGMKRLNESGVGACATRARRTQNGTCARPAQGRGWLAMLLVLVLVVRLIVAVSYEVVRESSWFVSPSDRCT